MNVTLNEAEIKLANYLALQRHSVNRQSGTTDRQMGLNDKLFIDLNGVGGELAVCKALGVYPDLEIGPRSGGFDLVTRRGYRADVKTTAVQKGRLLAFLDKKPEDSDIYILVVGEIPNYEIVGWCWAEELLKPENIIDLGHGRTYALSQDRLRDFGSKMSNRYTEVGTVKIRS